MKNAKNSLRPLRENRCVDAKIVDRVCHFWAGFEALSGLNLGLFFDLLKQRYPTVGLDDIDDQ